ncbi:MAG: hypothetical protein IT249_01000 [Chitinophagaceae bacterium]|nr:hypothetical protein [Chitinophagaceae bacterium]
MKNKLLKGAHLSEHKYKEIVQLFCEDVTATQIAEISGVSRVTVNNYFKLIRNHIAAHYEKKTAAAHAYVDVLSRDNYSFEEKLYYGFSVNHGKVFTQWLKNIDDSVLKLFINSVPGSTNEISSSFQNFQAIADCHAWRLHLLPAQVNNTSGLANALPEINNFWEHTKSRLHKFRGMNKNMLNLHIKECEFRYNYRNEELFPVLMEIINTPDNAYNVSRAYNLA